MAELIVVGSTPESILNFYGIEGEWLSTGFLTPYIHSNNELGIIYRIPNNIDFKPDYNLIMKTYIGAEITQEKDYIQVICVHKGAFEAQNKMKAKRLHQS